MPEVQIEIGGRTFTVACREGEENFLEAAAKILDAEANVILKQVGRMPPDRMLLMAGLMLADKTITLEDDVESLQAKVGARDKSLRSADERLADRARRIAELQDAPPHTDKDDTMADGLAELAARAEAIADELDGNQI